MKRTGEITEARALAVLTNYGWQVSIPWGDSARYDMLIERDGSTFYRVQVKTAQVHNDLVVVHTCSTNLEQGKWVKHSYRNTVDFILFEADGEFFVITPEEAPTREASFRKSRPSISTQRYLSDYHISKSVLNG